MQVAPRSILAPYLATPLDVVERMLDLAAVGEGDCVYDLGCGDGRVAIAAAQRGAIGFGVDCEPYWIERACAAAATAGVAHCTRFEVQDAMAVDPAPASVVFLYLVPWSTERMAERLRDRCRPGTRILSHSFPFRPGPGVHSESFTDAAGEPRSLHLWRLPVAPNTEDRRGLP